MGDVDTSVKDFIKLGSVFSQLFSQGVYGGRLRIDPDKLQEFDTAIQETVPLENGEVKMVERFRDAQKVGRISEKTKEDRELKKYSDGVPKGTRILPTVTLVFYTGSRPWDGPLRVYDMFDIPEHMKEWMKETTSDYHMNLIDARHMSDEEIDRFEGDLRAFLLMLRERFDREKLKTAVATHRETWYALSKIKNDKRYAEYIESVSDEDVEGGIYMDAALDYFEAIGEKKGQKIGEERGQKIGEERGQRIGEERGQEKVNKLGIMLSEVGRTNDFLKSLSDRTYQKKLFIEFGLEKEK